MADLKEIRVHIGNISPKLRANSTSLEQRLTKYSDSIISPLEFHTKPLQDSYFAYVTISALQSEFEKLKQALNGVVFMGMKLSVGVAKPLFAERLMRERERKEKLSSRKNLAKKVKESQIVEARRQRIQEARTRFPTNDVTGTVRTSTYSPQLDIVSKSEHTLNSGSLGSTSTSASTRDKHMTPTSRRIDGTKSYGAFTNSLIYKYRSGKSNSVIKGAHRRTPRKDPRSQTLRVLVNGELKTFKHFKTKLWGVEKKTARDLTYSYDPNLGWKSGDGHVVEAAAGTSCGINGRQAMNYGRDSDIEGVDGRGLNDTKEGDESSQNKSVLASILKDYDFDKPMELDDADDDEMGDDGDEIEVDSRGRKRIHHYDYEVEGKIDDEQRSASMEKQADVDVDVDDVIKVSTQELERPKEEVYYDEDDEGNDISDLQFIENARADPYSEEPTTVPKQSPSSTTGEAAKDEENQIEEDDSDSEFMPTFGVPSEPEPAGTTESLRSLLNPTTAATSNQETTAPATFTLALAEDDEDIDEAKAEAQRVQDEEQRQLLKQIQRKQQELLNQQQQQQQEQVLQKRRNQFGLFWPHFDSPFLSTQSQLSKIGSVDDEYKYMWAVESSGPAGATAIDHSHEGESAYEKWFWSIRGEMTRECKRRKRDLMRHLRKRK
ncbi:uncharacterized protein LODBEIA_P41650 [Lodderomyces beijingensis]|uniref:RRM domain-containing protein n=1 Tax=Lodderomyces beijingensis TaxID=1775926 RepID=A0ABP0ZP62_9ASCO